ncbi:unnamed protein product [Linum tenue]|uniref:B3 domain-containing protein Os07g0563300 n=1 Tax=Linum tenue TaxID=586396 RepID=A0AAV0PCT0_9ROSI|nr:unnamed protein product [Linum tenue]
MTAPSPAPALPPPQPPGLPVAVPPSAASAALNKCFNSDCTESKSKKGWRLRSGELAELCDRCGMAYEEGKFCEIFHPRASGWRHCESCAKRVHCGCIVSVSAFTLLDAGGIECVACAKKNVVLTSNTAWAPLFYHGYVSDSLKDLSVKNWNHLAGSGPVPWKQAPSLFNSSIPQTDAQPRMPYDVVSASERLSFTSQEKGKIDYFAQRLTNGNLKLSSRDKPVNANAGASVEEQQSSCVREDLSTLKFGMVGTYASTNEANGNFGCSGPTARATSSPLVKQISVSFQNVSDSPVEPRSRGRPRADARGRSQLLPRYSPRCTDEELAQISVNSNSIITPLFEKQLSPSDAGRIGRLVLPKKCAEAHFPPISQADGLPLKIQDAKGKEWIFQFRFWPNNNSRMYVLEGVTPCIQNMGLQAGDTVTFSRLEPEGKLVMGFRKASSALSSDQDNESSKPITGPSGNGEVDLLDPSPWSKVDYSGYIASSKVDKSGYIAKEILDSKPLVKKRKNRILGSKIKRLRLESEDMIELQITWEEAQGLLRPPPENIPSVVVIEGFEFEEFEDAPVLGKPTLLANDDAGHKVQWAQCEDCSKWRKLPANALLPSRWTCSSNFWDPERSSCLADQEVSREQLKDLLPPPDLAAFKKMKTGKSETTGNNKEEASEEGLDTLANLAILGGEGGGGEASSSQAATTKHPRHRPGCTCIVCIQPPSGKGPKHKQSCMCTVCQTVKRRFRTLMMNRWEKRQQREEKRVAAEAIARKMQPQQHQRSPIKDDDVDNNEDGSPASGQTTKPNPTTTGSPFKGQIIDLNIQPEREEEFSVPYTVKQQQQKAASLSASANTDGHRQQQQPEREVTLPPPDDDPVSRSDRVATDHTPSINEVRRAAADRTSDDGSSFSNSIWLAKRTEAPPASSSAPATTG